ncbi:MAG: hypothetical protein LC676_10735 [Loktanella sp.]|nr:hypothetical protein [Loktanella sp.]
MASEPEKQQAGQRLTLPQAAALVQKSDMWIRGLVRDGFIHQEKRGEYMPVNLIRGVIAYYESKLTEATKSATATKATEARTREIELRTAERARKLIPVEDSLMITSEIAQSARAEFAGLPARLTRDLETRRAMEAAIDEIFQRLAQKIGERGEALRTGSVDLDTIGEG